MSSYNMTGRTNGFTQKIMDAVGAQDVVISHCIIRQKNMSTKVFAFAEVMKNVVLCANYLRALGLYHLQLKAFLEYQDSDYPDVKHFSAVR